MFFNFFAPRSHFLWHWLYSAGHLAAEFWSNKQCKNAPTIKIKKNVIFCGRLFFWATQSCCYGVKGLRAMMLIHRIAQILQPNCYASQRTKLLTPLVAWSPTSPSSFTMLSGQGVHLGVEMSTQFVPMLVKWATLCFRLLAPASTTFWFSDGIFVGFAEIALLRYDSRLAHALKFVKIYESRLLSNSPLGP